MVQNAMFFVCTVTYFSLSLGELHAVLYNMNHQADIEKYALVKHKYNVHLNDVSLHILKIKI